MNKQDVIDAIKKVRENSKKRNFIQKFDLIINLKELDLKKAENQVESYVSLHYSTGKKIKVAAFIGPELSSQKDSVDLAITQEDFPKYEDKKTLKRVARDYDFFIAQATLMPKIATSFGKVLGPKGKMPNPKSGCVVPPNANLKQVSERLQKLVKLYAKSIPIIQVVVGNEQTKDEEMVDNIMTVYNQLVHSLPNEKHNIKNIHLKLTMGKPVEVGKEAQEEAQEKKGKKKVVKKESEVEKTIEEPELVEEPKPKKTAKKEVKK